MCYYHDVDGLLCLQVRSTSLLRGWGERSMAVRVAPPPVGRGALAPSSEAAVILRDIDQTIAAQCLVPLNGALKQRCLCGLALHALHREQDWICDVCERTYTPSIATFACTNDCDFDVCAQCMAVPVTCPQYHRLVLRPTTKDKRAVGRQCDQCQVEVQGDSATRQAMGCPVCDFDLCVECFTALTFAGLRLRDAETDTSLHRLNAGIVPAVQVLVPDAVSVVLQFASVTAVEVIAIGGVCRSWREAMLNDHALWQQIRVRRWPQRGQLPSHGTATWSSVRARGLVEMRLRHPSSRRIPADSMLTPIENCDFTVKCPLVTNALRRLGIESVAIWDARGASAVVDEAVDWCSICARRVYSVESQEAADWHAARNECVAWTRPLPVLPRQTREIAVLSVNDAGHEARLHIEGVISALSLHDTLVVVRLENGVTEIAAPGRPHKWHFRAVVVQCAPDGSFKGALHQIRPAELVMLPACSRLRLPTIHAFPPNEPEVHATAIVGMWRFPTLVRGRRAVRR